MSSGTDLVPSETPAAVDILITGGLVHDGSGAPVRITQIAITGDTIAYIGDDAGERFLADSVIDASSLIVAPGFIDPHTHAGSDLASSEAGRRANPAFAFQGVTTVMIGNDGFGSPQIAGMAGAAQRLGIGTNVGFLVGHGAVREAVLGKANRAPDAGELARMEAITRQALCEGAWGFSAGLYYVPQNYAKTDEVIALARVASGLGGYYDTHMRDESTYNVTVTGALAEALEIGREAEIPVHISHIKALGPAVWGHSARMIAMIEKARAEGQRVTADQYPWEASGTRISNALVPRDALEGGLDALRGRLATPEQRAAIRKGMITGLARRGGADKLLITGRLGGSEAAIGSTLAQIAKARDIEPVDAALAILEVGDARVASFNMNPDDIAAFASRDWVVTGSDGSNGHPRKYASFPKAYRDLVKGQAQMDIARFIRRSSGMTADIIGLEKRGYLREGYFADIVIFDPDRFAPQATYQTPRELSSGVVHLLVNGQGLIEDGQINTGPSGAMPADLPGRALLKDAPC